VTPSHPLTHEEQLLEDVTDRFGFFLGRDATLRLER
jgi:hypothetical protein